MHLLLNSGWNIGVAMGELTSSLFLVFFILVMSSTFKKINNTIFKTIGVPFFYSISGMAAIYIGLVIGSAAGAPGSSISFANPMTAIATSIIFDSFQGLTYIIPMEILGSFIGVALFAGFFKMSNYMDDKKEPLADSLLIDEDKSGKILVKNIIGFTILAPILFFIPLMDKTQYDVSYLVNSFITGILVTIPLIITARWNYFAFAITVPVATGVLAMFVKKDNKKKIARDVLMVFSLQIVITLLFAYGYRLIETNSSFFHYH